MEYYNSIVAVFHVMFDHITTHDEENASLNSDYYYQWNKNQFNIDGSSQDGLGMKEATV